jgi:hypothetical protein
MGQSHLEEYGRWSSRDPFGHLIHYDLKCCIAELWSKVFFSERKRWKSGLQVPPTNPQPCVVGQIEDYGLK